MTKHVFIYDTCRSIKNCNANLIIWISLLTWYKFQFKIFLIYLINMKSMCIPVLKITYTWAKICPSKWTKMTQNFEFLLKKFWSFIICLSPCFCYLNDYSYTTCMLYAVNLNWWSKIDDYKLNYTRSADASLSVTQGWFMHVVG